MTGLLVFLISFAVLAVAELIWRARATDDSGQRLATNFLLGAVNIAIAAALPVSVLATAVFAGSQRIGLMNQVAFPAVAALLVTLLARTLTGYWVHRMVHARALLWRFHRVHHADREVDLSTALRNHPGELILMITALGGVALVLGAPPWAVAAIETAIATANLWSHANLRLTPALERILGRVLVTPGLHLVHHSASRAECDSNYGELLTLWDRLFGTFRELQPVARIGLGSASDAHADHLLRQLRSPFESR
ncbi:sterol desaturase family protein [Sphingomonas sp. G-3-2-10]|uniref:sterol desaturase family protein n=1 Tax=Sphingomonas sp. G-3-2-10 TaxID=2728838 RepID=UPI00146C4747|nr:sterol desaturase family protein [Sphingomonas sp. G-3-2-10]NML07388.1 sterol desaturase family protein [Sphingomonas sp. G-3-2-10]